MTADLDYSKLERQLRCIPAFDKLLHYDAESGLFTCRRKFGRYRVGDRVGYLRRGYLTVTIAGRIYSLHRVAWRLVKGVWPPEMIDHINGNKSDNRWTNLRAATAQQNVANSPVRGTSRTGRKGVAQKPDGAFEARISLNLGTATDVETAADLYRKAAKSIHGEFAHQS